MGVSWPRVDADARIDVGLLLEGTYPFVSGGVSSWIHEIVTGLPELSFGIVFLGGNAATTGEIKYRRPPNLVHLEVHHLMDPASARSPPPPAASRSWSRSWSSSWSSSWRGALQPLLGALGRGSDGGGDGPGARVRPLARLHQVMRERAAAIPGDLIAELGALDGPDGLALDDFLAGDAAWQLLCETYELDCPRASFIDFFWTTRIMLGPLFALARIARQTPGFRVLHAVSTGYAGYLGALLHEQRGRPLVLTEHGIYTKERKIDLAQAAWIRDAAPASAAGRRAGDLGGSGSGAEPGPLRQMWIRFFEALGRIAYAAADPIVSLYEGNRLRQIADGAAGARTRVIANGIDIARFSAARSGLVEGPGGPERALTPPPVIGLIGRVVPIKDIKTFIRAVHSVLARLPEAEGWIVGPEDEDPRYARECRALVDSLGLRASLRFTGFQRAEDVLPRLGVLVVSSISEALPLVILEAFAAGVPVVSTDVGACRALVEGRPDDPADAALGPAGAVTHIASPDALGRAVVALLGDPPAWRRARASGWARVNASYARDLMFTAYRGVYRAALDREDPAHGRDWLRAS
jgi:glycosyltransferase involved in cell wall biosynthesis